MAGLQRVCLLLVSLVMAGVASGHIVLMGENISKSFDDIEANFTPRIKPSGENGVLYLAEPIDACSPLTNKMVGGAKPPFALIIRGSCSFDDKIKSAQSAGFKAVIIYDNVDGAPLVTMDGTSYGITIPAVFVSKFSGNLLKQYSGRTDVDLWLLPTYENSPWSIMAVSFMSLLFMSSLLATCFYACKHHVRRERPRNSQVPELRGMSDHLVKAMPSLIFTTVLEDNSTSRTCAICLEDYNKGEKLRVLPCCHKFHSVCVDSWLTAWRTFCPICKRDANMSINAAPASESTPLLSSNSPYPLSSTVALSSSHSSFRASTSVPIHPSPTSPPVQIVSTSPWNTSASRTHSLSTVNSQRSYNVFPGSSINGSFADLRSIPSQRCQMSLLVPPHSAGLSLPPPYGSRHLSPYTSPLNASPPSYLSTLSSRHSSRYARTFKSGSTNESPSYLVGSSSRCSYLLPTESRGLPLTSPYSSRYAHPYSASSSNASPSYLVGSSGHYSYLRHCESGASISAEGLPS